MSLVGGCEGLSDRERRTNGALGIVLVRRRRAEHRHDSVSDELLDGPPAPRELLPHERVVRAEHRPDVLDVHTLGSTCEPHEVGEQHRDDLALFPTLGEGAERRPATATEP